MFLFYFVLWCHFVKGCLDRALVYRIAKAVCQVCCLLIMWLGECSDKAPFMPHWNNLVVKKMGGFMFFRVDFPKK